MKKITKYLCGIVVLLIISCSKDTIPINLGIENYYEFPVGKTSTITIQGSDDYQIVIENDSILNVSYKAINQFSVSPIKKGETCFVVLDKETGATAKANIKIVDHYYSFQMANPLHAPFLSNEYLFL